MTRIRTRLLALTLVSVAAGPAAGQQPADLVISSDPELRALATRLLPDLATRAGMELRSPVRLEMRGRAELVRYLEAKLDEELPPEEARDRTEAYALFGLVSPDLDLRTVLLGLYTEQVAGFYEPDSTALFVLDDQPPEALEALLVHELVHAVQDQNADLRALTDEDLGSDRVAAAQATIEGHATLVMFEYMTEQMTGAPIDLGQIPDFAAQVRPALQAMNSQFPALASTPRVIREALLFPYVEGAGFVQRLWADEARRDPFGDRLPESTEQILWADAAPPLGVGLSVDSGRIVFDEVMGALELNIFLEDVLGLPGGRDGPYRGSAGALTAAWDGDRYALVERTDGSRVLSWHVVWSDERARDRFVEAVEAARTAFGGPVEVEAITLSGRPASWLRVGVGQVGMRATLDGPGA